MQAKDYPVTFPYGATTPPYSLTHPHKGEDRKMPKRTEVRINGTLVGYAGTTGKSTGVHTHTQKVADNRVVNPRGGGFDVPQPTTVVATGFNLEIGNYIRYMDNDGVMWSIFHLDELPLVKVNDKLGEENMLDATIQNEEDNRQLFLAWCARNPYPHEVGRYIGKKVKDAFNDIAKNANRKDIDKMCVAYYKNGSQIPTNGFVPVNEQLYRKA